MERPSRKYAERADGRTGATNCGSSTCRTVALLLTMRRSTPVCGQAGGMPSSAGTDCSAS